MGVLLSLATAVLYGSADFAGGMASARARVIDVLFRAHLIGMVGIAAVALVAADAFFWRDALLGAGGGIAGLTGVFLLYRRLALGPMHVVAPLSGVTSAITPALWGVASGERLSTMAWIGVALALVAIVLVSISGGERRGGERAAVTPMVIAESLASGFGFGAFFVFLAETSEATSPWPVACARVTTVVVLGCIVWRARRDVGDPDRASTIGPGLWALIAWAGLADTGANVAFLFASQRGDLAVVSVLSSLYPLATVVLARVVLGDRMSPRQFVGLLAALVGTGLIVGAG